LHQVMCTKPWWCYCSHELNSFHFQRYIHEKWAYVYSPGISNLVFNRIENWWLGSWLKRTQIETFQQLYEADTKPNSRAQNLVDYYELQDMPTESFKDLRRPKHPWVLETHDDPQQHWGRFFCKNDTPDNAHTQ
jgi:hypothetical protein